MTKRSKLNTEIRKGIPLKYDPIINRYRTAFKLARDKGGAWINNIGVPFETHSADVGYSIKKTKEGFNVYGTGEHQRVNFKIKSKTPDRATMELLRLHLNTKDNKKIAEYYRECGFGYGKKRVSKEDANYYFKVK